MILDLKMSLRLVTEVINSYSNSQNLWQSNLIRSNSGPLGFDDWEPEVKQKPPSEAAESLVPEHLVPKTEKIVKVWHLRLICIWKFNMKQFLAQHYEDMEEEEIGQIGRSSGSKQVWRLRKLSVSHSGNF